MKRYPLIGLIILALISSISWLSQPAYAQRFSTVTMIGDSVTLGAKPALEKQLPGIKVDAQEGRQVTDATNIIAHLKANHQLGRTVIIALGTNGPFSAHTGQRLIKQIGSHRKIYWVNIYGQGVDWATSNNQTIRFLVKHHQNVQLIDWYHVARQHPQWFYDDGIHLQPAGQTGFAKLIKHSVNQ